VFFAPIEIRFSEVAISEINSEGAVVRRPGGGLAEGSLVASCSRGRGVRRNGPFDTGHLGHFWFVSDVVGFRAIAIAQSPAAFRRRGIFIACDALSRV